MFVILVAVIGVGGSDWLGAVNTGSYSRGPVFERTVLWSFVK